MDDLVIKYENLKKLLKSYRKMIVAFSGGIDSSLLVKVGHDILGDDMIAVTSKSSTLSNEEFQEAIKTTKEIGCKHEVLSYEETDDDNFRNNPINRCFYCKSMLFSKLRRYAIEYGYNNIVEGTNYDDVKGHRPGLEASKNFDIKSPLLELCFTKIEIRGLSKKLGLKNYNKPEMACLSSRFPTGSLITTEKLKMVEEAESFIKKVGVSQLRVRHLGETAKIEVLISEIDKIKDNFKFIEKGLTSIGFKKVVVDENGYRRGSLVEI